MNGEKKQVEKFREAARGLECDDDEARFDERVKKLVKQKSNERHAVKREPPESIGD